MTETEVARSSPNYTVKSIEILAEVRDLRASLYTLAPGDVIPWHFHSHVADRYFCLGGILRVETRAPRAGTRVGIGESYTIAPKTAHRISNGGDADCRFLLLQGVGLYDFHKIRDQEAGGVSRARASDGNDE